MCKICSNCKYFGLNNSITLWKSKLYLCKCKATDVEYSSNSKSAVYWLYAASAKLLFVRKSYTCEDFTEKNK